MSIDTYKRNYQKHVNFIDKYKRASNASTGSEVDSNANVQTKNVTTMAGEIPKKVFIGTNRLLMINKLTDMLGEEYAEEYIRQLESHEIYKHDETSVAPYTYGANEVVNIIYNNMPYVVSFKRLYDLCKEQETCLDEVKDVWAKYPINMQIEDRFGFTNVNRLIRKKRHRDLVRVKTAFSNDIIVTDNHPMIVSDNIDQTIEARSSTNYNQYFHGSKMKFGNTTCIKSSEIAARGNLNMEELEHGYIVQESSGCRRHAIPKQIAVDRELGYFVGFFIGDGDYNASSTNINITQKDNVILKKLADIAFTHFNTASSIFYDISYEKYKLTISNPIMYILFKRIFHIEPYAQNKTLPENVFGYTEEFAIGLIEGLVDSDGSVDGNGSYNIRISSRTAIMQTAMILNAMGLTTGCFNQQTKFGQNNMATQKYQLFGIRFREPTEPHVFNQSLKNTKATHITKGQKSHFDEWLTVTNVEKIDNQPYLDMNEYIYDITTESHTFICNGLWVHNCVSISMYPFILNGLKQIGGASEPPKHLSSFCGSFINLVFAVAAQFAGAVATPEFLTYFDYFVRKEYGDDYYLRHNDKATIGLHEQTIDEVLMDAFQQVTYSLNQPAAARNYQSVFWNIAYFDKPYFKGIFNNFIFPDGTEPKWESVSWIQKRYMEWFNQERLKCADLTFPVETLNLLHNGTNYVDKEWFDFGTKMYAKGHSFFTYISDSVDSLASCCRLKNQIQKNTFSYTLGAGGIATGSKGVITININRLVQNAVRDGVDIEDAVRIQIKKNHKYLLAYNEIINDYFNARMLPIYDAGFIKLSGQYLTNGINGFVEGAEFLGIDISPNNQYFQYGEKILRPMFEENRKAKTDDIMFNSEFVPAENLGIKNAKWDMDDGYVVPRDCYNSYFYRVEDDSTNIVDKFILHGDRLTKYLDGGSALHCNMDEHLSQEQYKKLLNTAIKTGCSYFTFNIPNTVCNDCGYIEKRPLKVCPKCGSTNLDYLTRVIGYLKRVSAFSEPRQKEAAQRYYANGTSQV